MTLPELIPVRTCIPVVTVADNDEALGVAAALRAGGVRIVEFTLRAGDAFAAVAAVRERFPDLVLALGTVLTPDDVARAARCGTRFIVSPGFSDALAQAVRRHRIGWLPGACTPSEVLRVTAAGFDFIKFFPASAAGGADMLKQLHAVFPRVRFCPTGGIGEQQVKDYLALPNVHCVGGSWVTPAALVAARDWAGITALARRAATPA